MIDVTNKTEDQLKVMDYDRRAKFKKDTIAMNNAQNQARSDLNLAFQADLKLIADQIAALELAAQENQNNG